MTRIDFESEWTPPISIDRPFAPGEPGAATAIQQFMLPKISFYLAGGGDPVVVAPAGMPGPTKWPWVEIGGLALGLGFLYLLFRPRRAK